MNKPLDPRKLKEVRALVLDVDGVLTDGRIVYDASGQEIKSFSVHDGLGIKMLLAAGIQAAIISGRSSPALSARARDLGIRFVWDSVSDKARVLAEVEAALGVPAPAMACMGDDLPDLGLFSRVGVPIAVPGAHRLVLDAALMVTGNPGGQGAVREVCEAILEAQGRMHGILQGFSS